MSTQANVIVCTPWAKRSRLIACELRICSACGVAVAISLDNVKTAERLDLAVICLDCIDERVLSGDGVEFTGGMFDGEVVPLDKAFRMARALLDRN